MDAKEKAKAALVQSPSKKARSLRSLTDGSIKAEAIFGGRIHVSSSPSQKVQKGAWLELAKTDKGKGLLRVRNASRDETLFAVPTSGITWMDCPESHLKPCSFLACTSPFRHLLTSGRIFEFDAETVDDERIHAAFLVVDPEGWMAALEAPEWHRPAATETALQPARRFEQAPSAPRSHHLAPIPEPTAIVSSDSIRQIQDKDEDLGEQ